jgi:hypothetical protein
MLSQQLGTLPFAGMKQSPNLALRNLVRGAAFGLPSGQRVAERMENMRLKSHVLEPDEIKKAEADGFLAAKLGFDEGSSRWSICSSRLAN